MRKRPDLPIQKTSLTEWFRNVPIDYELCEEALTLRHAALHICREIREEGRQEPTETFEIMLIAQRNAWAETLLGLHTEEMFGSSDQSQTRIA